MNQIISIKEDSELGTLHFVRSQRARRINVKILPNRLEIVLPIGVSEAEAMKFINSVRQKLLTYREKVEDKTITITSENPLKTLSFTVHPKKAKRKDIYSSMKSGILTIEYPDNLEETDERTQQYFWESINYFLRNEAKRLLPNRVAQLAKHYGFTFSLVKIQSSKTRWGSCNQLKTINLSLYLHILPQHLIDYVILHELCHTLEMNHSPRFWELMEKVTNGASYDLDKELKKYAIPQ